MTRSGSRDRLEVQLSPVHLDRQASCVLLHSRAHQAMAATAKIGIGCHLAPHTLVIGAQAFIRYVERVRHLSTPSSRGIMRWGPSRPFHMLMAAWVPSVALVHARGFRA
jgi:hypothetical protein